MSQPPKETSKLLRRTSRINLTKDIADFKANNDLELAISALKNVTITPTNKEEPAQQSPTNKRVKHCGRSD